MILEYLSDSSIVRVLGIYLFFKIIISITYSVYDYIRWRFHPIDIKSYGEWAAITGSTDGIGKAMAREMAKRGSNIILISRSEDKLNNTAKEIENDFQVKTFCIQADFTDRHCYKNIKDKIQNLDIGILVNNVGVAHLPPTTYTRFTEQQLWEEIDVNCGAATIMTRLVLPQMKANRKGLIVNVSSMASCFGLPWVGVYAGTKSFLNMFSYNIQEEVIDHNIQVRCLIPGFVRTKILGDTGPVLNKLEQTYPLLEAFYPDAEKYALHAVNSLSSSSIVLTGYWPHTILASTNWLSLEFKLRVTSYLFKLLGRMTQKKNIKEK